MMFSSNMATQKQQLVAKILLENTGKSVSQAMREAGYNRGSWRNPQQLTRSVGWKELMEKYLPDEELLKVHRELLDKKVIVKSFDKKGNIVFIEKIDVSTVYKALDLAYKIKGKYKLNINYEHTIKVTSEQFNRLISK